MPVAVVSETLAGLVAADSNPLGRQLVVLRQPQVGEAPPEPRTVTIVGVAADTDTGILGQRQGIVVYLPCPPRRSVDPVIALRAE